MTTAPRICPLCEATCGLILTIDGPDRSDASKGASVVEVRGDPEDVFSRGYICPKGVALGELHADPNRLTTPMLRQPDGTLAPATWDEAFGAIRDRLTPIITEHGPQSVGLFPR
jgi:anaerobic selenocysteine-containing dehydrogenase